MKKLLIAFMLLAVLVVPMFADQTMKVKTEVSLDETFGFTESEYTNEKTPIEPISAEKVVTHNGDNTYYASIRTNARKAYDITLTHTDLKLQDENGDVVGVDAESIPLLLAGKTAGTSHVIPVTKGKKMRAISKEFALTFSEADFLAASVGVYKATITMTITAKD